MDGFSDEILHGCAHSVFLVLCLLSDSGGTTNLVLIPKSSRAKKRRHLELEGESGERQTRQKDPFCWISPEQRNSPDSIFQDPPRI